MIASVLIALVAIVLLAILIVAARLGRLQAVREALRGPFHLKRSNKNPIISPRKENGWEAEGVFNPAAVKIDGKVHLLFRTTGTDGVSRIGYASTEDGITITERSIKPVYIPREWFEGAVSVGPGFSQDVWGSGGGWGGCEDPKATYIEDEETIYMTYVANNGWGPQRIALTSISKKDFLNKNWEKGWKKAKLISRPGEINKSAVILPKKIHGKYAIFHRVFPDILVDYVDDLQFKNDSFLEPKHRIPARKDKWDSRKASVGATPIETPYGWLTIYHAVDNKDSGKYKIGAMLLKKDEPHVVLARSDEPILEPDAPYENDWKPGVAYPSGAAVVGDQLHVYYGGGDKYVCVASTPVNDILNYLLKSGPKPQMTVA
ncbi:MAG: hypothetical protein HYV68_01110 [Candidatus Taylorbacteria bacterium]|nr:hypothetical protein [Candidatus Taylorbacteria bacterium]